MMPTADDYERRIERQRCQLADSQEFAKLFSWRWVLATGDIELSDTAVSILGIVPDTWTASHESIVACAHADDRNRINEEIARAIAAGGDYRIEYRVVRSDGQVREFWERGRCEVGPCGEIVAVNAIAQDITWLRETEHARERAPNALQKREEQFRSAIEVSPTGTGLMAPNGTWLFANEALCGLLGYSQSELLAASWQMMTHPDEAEGRGAFLLEMLDRKIERHHAECRLISKEGRTIWVLLNASLVRTSGGAPRYFILQVNDISERKNFETALRAGKERYHRLLQAMPDPVVVRRNGKLEFANAAAIDLVGAAVTREDTEERLLGLTSPDSRKMPGVGSSLAELQLNRPDGSRIDLEINESSYLDIGGESVVTILRDITLRKRGEQALRDSEEQLRLIADSVPILLARVDRNGRYLFLNLEGEKRSAIRRSEVLGRSLFDVLGDAEYRKVKPYFERALCGESLTFSTSILYPNGAERQVEAFYIPDLGPDGSVRGVVMVSIDVTDRMKAEAELRESVLRYRQLVESTNAVPYAWSFAERRYTYLGPQAERLFGHSAEQLADRLFWIQQIHSDDQEHVLRHLDRLETEPQQAQIEYRVVTSAGKTLWLHDTARVETTEAGQRVAHGIIIDITENKVRDRQVEQAQKIEALGQMTGGIAHDFNNLLTVIMINLELVASRLSGEVEQKRVAQAIRAADAGTQLTTRMLAFARRQVLHPMVMDLSDLVTDFHGMLRRTLDESISTSVQLCDDIWSVRVDRGALDAALLNLTVNARDAMPRGGELTITTANVVFDEASAERQAGLKAGAYSMLAVSDTGTGMPPEVLARAFEPFFTTKEIGKGTGLGLSMVYGFAKQSNGFVYIDSEIGLGTTVRLYLPKVESREAAAVVDFPKPEGMPSGSETILVVEDSAAVRSAAAALLKSLGYRVLQACDGPSALQLIDEHSGIDLILSDIVMPGGMKGPDLARRALELRPQVKLLYMSGYADDPSIRDGVFEPYAEVVGKPFHSDRLATKVREALDTPKVPRRGKTRRSRAKIKAGGSAN
jgi:PAS domain S-box-containing protein